jgi:outer membrane biosynthesis protein TonB
MNEAVSDIIASRARVEVGFTRSVGGSVFIHVLGLVALFFAHQYVLAHRPAPPKIMTITLGGPNGPRATGTTAASSRAVDQVAPQPKHEVVKTAASQSSVMTLPIKSEPKPTPKVQDLPITSMPKPATTGAQIQKGTAQAETGSTAQSTGLTVGGAGGSTGMLEITDFCCPEYLKEMIQRVELQWDKNARERGETTLRFVIHRDGTVTDISTDKTTSEYLRLQSLSALMRSHLPPLPAEFKDDHLVIHLRFPYGIQ